MYYLVATFFSLLILSTSCSSSKDEPSPYIRIAMTDDPLALDPRLVRDLSSSSIMRMLYEGLTRPDLKGEIIPAIAESYSLSSDGKVYTFHLRETSWSDGSPLTSKDFKETWETMLSPNFPAPNAYQLYVIKGAKAAKEGKIALEDIGVKTPDSFTLVIELEQPAPYFLELLSCHFFFPIHESMRKADHQEAMVGNGPFQLDKWNKRSELVLVQNSLYWDKESVLLKGIVLHVLDEHTAFQLFKAGELDWVGSPLSTLPQDSLATLKQEKELAIAPGAGTHWFRINTQKTPFDEVKVRQAFALVLNRQAIIDHVTQGNQSIAIGIVPPSFGLKNQSYYLDNQIEKAQEIFNEAMKEYGLTKSDFSQVTLSYVSNDRNHKIAQAIQQQWNKAFDINMVLSGNESHMQLDNVKKGNYFISMGSWYADIQDPINFLEIFKYKDNPTNQTFWQNTAYANLLDQSSTESDLKKRQEFFSSAEALLIQEMPVIPLFHSSYNYLKNEKVENVYFSPLGFLDFKNASLK